METTTQELIYQIMALIISGVFGLLGMYLKNKIDFEKYGFENDRAERIIDNAINFAEQRAKVLAKSGAVTIDGKIKLETAKQYINKVDPKIISKYGDQIENMIDRKVAQKFGTK